MIHRPREFVDFFGAQTSNPPILRVSCPLLAFFGTKVDLGGEKEVLLLKSSVQRPSKWPPERQGDNDLLLGTTSTSAKSCKSLRRSPTGSKQRRSLGRGKDISSIRLSIALGKTSHRNGGEKRPGPRQWRLSGVSFPLPASGLRTPSRGS